MSADPRMSRYLAAVFAEARPATLVEIRWRAGDAMRQRFVPAADLGAVAREIARLSAMHDVYVGVLPRWRAGGRRADVVGDGRTVWVDLDRPDALRTLDRVEPAPALVTASGGAGHAHAYWRLRRAVPPRIIERANGRLAFALGGDLRAGDAARILRPPGTVNLKRGTPVELLHAAERKVLLGELVGELPDPPGWRPSAPRRTSQRRPAAGVLALPPEIYVQRLTGQRVGRSRKVRCPLHDDSTPSLHVYRDASRGWFCFGCGRGGTVVDLAAALWFSGQSAGAGGAALRGARFVEVRERLLAMFCDDRVDE